MTDQPNITDDRYFADLLLELDERDYHAVQSAIAHGQRLVGGLPEGVGNIAGRVVAEICRSWMEMLKLTWNQP